MRVLALVTDAFGAYGGIAQYNRDLIYALASRNKVKEVTVFPRIAPEPLVSDDRKIRLLLPEKSRIVYTARALFLALTERPDIIFSGHLYHGPLAHRLASITGARLISQLHGTEAWAPLSTQHLKSLESSDIVLCVSNDTKNRYLAQATPGTDNAYVLPNTVGEEFVVGNRATARKKFGLSDEFVILTVGRLDPRNGGYKGHERVIRTLRSLEASGRDITYLIAGIGDDRDRLEKIVQDLGVTNEVRFLGKVLREDLPDLYRAADLFVLPSTGEGFGIVFLEAMACGTRALGLAAGGAPDALGDGKLGILVDVHADFPAALQVAIQSVDGNREELSSIIQARFGQTAFRQRVAQVIEMLQ